MTVNASTEQNCLTQACHNIFKDFSLIPHVFRFERIGIYVVMFREISRTLLSIIVLFFYLILGFSLAFYALMIEQVCIEVLLNDY